MLVGYARVSTTDQNLDLQNDALQSAGCERLFTDTASGAKAERPGLTQALKECRQGDTLSRRPQIVRRFFKVKVPRFSTRELRPAT